MVLLDSFHLIHFIHRSTKRLKPLLYSLRACSLVWGFVCDSPARRIGRKKVTYLRPILLAGFAGSQVRASRPRYPHETPNKWACEFNCHFRTSSTDSKISTTLYGITNTTKGKQKITLLSNFHLWSHFRISSRLKGKKTVVYIS